MFKRLNIRSSHDSQIQLDIATNYVDKVDKFKFKEFSFYFQ